MPSTWGRRQRLGLFDDAFGGPNPYSDEPAAEARTVESVTWSDSIDVPEATRRALAEAGRFALRARVREWDGREDFKAFTERADPRFIPRTSAIFSPGCSTGSGRGTE